MSMVEVHLPQPLFALSNECVTQRSRLRVLLHFVDNRYNFGVFCFGLANCYFAERGAKREKKKLNYPVRDKNRKNYSAGSRELSRIQSAALISIILLCGIHIAFCSILLSPPDPKTTLRIARGALSPFTLAPEIPARRSCRHRDKSDHVDPVPKRLSAPA